MFDHDGDGFMDMGELKRAFRAIGLQKRSGEKLEMDEEMFKSFDTNGDGKVSVEEFDANVPAAVRAKIIEKLESGWKFDPALWAASTSRHSKTNFAKIFKKFDVDNDGFLDFRELQRAFRAIGLKKRAGANYELDAMTFKAFDANGDGKVCAAPRKDATEPPAWLPPWKWLSSSLQILRGLGLPFSLPSLAPDPRSSPPSATTSPATTSPATTSHATRPGVHRSRWRSLIRTCRTLCARSSPRSLMAAGSSIRRCGKLPSRGTRPTRPTKEARPPDLTPLQALAPSAVTRARAPPRPLWPHLRPAPLTLLVSGETLPFSLRLVAGKAFANQEPIESKFPMGEIFMQFDTDGDGVLDASEFQRALRAIGLEKREGDKKDLDAFTFKQMDTNGDGKLSIEEFDANLPLALRAKIEAKLADGWVFDEEKWKASQERHAQWNMAKVFAKFDTDGDGVLDLDEFQRGFRAIGLKKRSGEKYEIDEAMFKSFDTNG